MGGSKETSCERESAVVEWRNTGVSTKAHSRTSPEGSHAYTNSCVLNWFEKGKLGRGRKSINGGAVVEY